MKFNSIIFDLDGTLINSLEDIADSMNRVLKKHGLPEHDMQTYRYFIGHGVPTLVRKAVPPDLSEEGIIESYAWEFRETYGKNYNIMTKLYDGIPDMLDKLSDRKIRMSIFSNKPDDFTKKCVKEFLRPWKFECVMGHGSGIPPKPDPKGVLKILKDMEQKPADTIYLGDSGIDMITAVSAGMFPIGALWGFRDRDELRENGARELVKDPGAILSFL